ncbi:hypothetical protein M3Y96_00023100 [Aphelenchoides besseyi]|nr:hypothetical protein M3Y96_00023100 [Aphelenchoides besseyi]
MAWMELASSTAKEWNSEENLTITDDVDEFKSAQKFVRHSVCSYLKKPDAKLDLRIDFVDESKDNNDQGKQVELDKNKPSNLSCDRAIEAIEQTVGEMAYKLSAVQWNKIPNEIVGAAEKVESWLQQQNSPVGWSSEKAFRERVNSINRQIVDLSDPTLDCVSEMTSVDIESDYEPKTKTEDAGIVTDFVEANETPLLGGCISEEEGEDGWHVKRIQCGSFSNNEL